MFRTCLAAAATIALTVDSLVAQAPAPKAGGATGGPAPVIVIETVKGTFEFETYPQEAPRTVAHIVALVKRGFYNGQRFHRVVPGFVVQVGDPQSRDMTKRESWGRGAAATSGSPIGVAEFSKKRTHATRGTVAMAHPEDATKADSQFYVTLAPRPELDGKYTVFGQVTTGLDVLSKIEMGDVLKRATVKEAPPK
jgi:peptidyl-prolyl cis-trans isomerase B (cyclophilin B)